MTLAALDSDTDLTLKDEVKVPPLCESDHCQDCGRGVHEADYVAILPCSFAYNICEARYAEYPLQVLIRCDDPKFHYVVWSEIVCFPLRG